MSEVLQRELAPCRRLGSYKTVITRPSTIVGLEDDKSKAIESLDYSCGKGDYDHKDYGHDAYAYKDDDHSHKSYGHKEHSKGYGYTKNGKDYDGYNHKLPQPRQGLLRPRQ